MKTWLKSATVAVLAVAAAAVQAQSYPNKPIRVVVPTVPGPLDAFARSVLEVVSQRLKQPFIIDNKPGAGGNLGADIVAKAAPDGYTLLFAIDTTFTVNPTLYKKLPFDPDKDFATISVPVTYGQMLAVHPSVKANNLQEFVALAKKGGVRYASGGNGTPSHLTMAAFLAAANLEMAHIPYKGTGASVIDVMGGQVESLFAVTSGVLPNVKGGKLRALAVSSPQRSALATEVPAVAEAGYPGFDASFAYAFMAPAGTPDAIVQLLAREVAIALDTPEMKEKNRQADYAATGFSAQRSATWLRDMRKRWADVITQAKIKIEE